MRRARRGQATVELAVAMLVIVPIFLYVLFLDDLLRYKLDLQENIITVPWDLATIDYQKPTVRDRVAGDSNQDDDQGETSVQRFNRLQYCDHTSAYDSYNGTYDCRGEVHHRALSAHMCFLVGQGRGKQVTCTNQPKKEVGANLNDQAGIGTALRDGIQSGGFYRCGGKAGVINYFLPNKVFSSFTNVDMTVTRYHYQDISLDGTGTHASESPRQDDPGGNVFPLKEQQFSLITDTWALTEVEETDTLQGQRDTELYKRIELVYGQGQTAMQRSASVMQFLAQAQSDGLLNMSVGTDTGAMGDDTGTPEVTFTANRPPDMYGYNSAHWLDWQNNLVQSTNDNRGEHYLGAQGPPSDY